MSSAPAGATVVFEPGTYGATGTRTSWTSAGTSSAPITFIGDPRTDSRPVIFGYNVLSGAHVRVWNLFFDGPTGIIPGENQQEVMVWAEAPDIQIDDSEIAYSLWHAGIYLTNADADKLLGNYIHDNGDFGDANQANEDQGIYWASGTGGVIADNLIAHNYSFGVQLYPNANSVTLEWNTLVGNGKSGVIIDSSSADNTVENNIAADNAQQGVRSGSSLTGTGNRVQNNFFWNNEQGNGGPDISGLMWTGNFVADPQFVGGGGYALQATSPAIAQAGASQNGQAAF